MNRDGQEPPEGAQAEEPDNIIAFPGARMRAVPPAAPEAGDAAEPKPTEERSADEQGMTLDAFERAVRSAVREKLGDAPDGSRPQGADELVAQVFSALTGKDPKTALSEVRQRLSEPQPPAEDPPEGDVIDLGAVREARQRATIESAQKIGGAIKDTLGQFIANIAQRQGMSGEVTLDAGFFKQHGSALLGNLFQGLASALMQQNATRAPVPPEAPTAPPHTEATAASNTEATGAPNAEATGAPNTEANAAPNTEANAAPNSPPTAAPGTTPGATPPPEARQVQVKLDLGSILAGLFRRREPPPGPNQ